MAMELVLCGFVLILLQFHGVDGLAENGINVITNVQSRRVTSYTTCNFWYLDRCSRHRTEYYKVHVCKSGYRSTDNHGCPHAICDNVINPNGACNINYRTSHIIYSNGKTQYSSGGTCSLPEICTNCKMGFYASPNRCRMCSAISNCDLEECTSPSDQVCSRCEGVYMDRPGERAYVNTTDNKSCIQACSWRSDSTRCYPGVCAKEYARNCICTTEFSGTHCEKIDKLPSILYNTLKVTGSGLDKVEAPDNPNEGAPQDKSWTNINDTRMIYYKFETKFIMTATPPLRQAYVEGFAVGIINAKATFEVKRNGYVIRRTVRPCNGPSKTVPHQTKLTCEENVTADTFLSHHVENGDLMEFTFEATNGGYVKVRNKESGSLVTYFYEGKTQINRYILGFDFIDPHHCSVDLKENCRDDMISLAKTHTQTPISVTWQGWRDDVLVFSYLVSIFELYDQHPDSQLVEKSLAFEPDRYIGETSSSQFHLSHPGVYALVLTAYDKAKNRKSARRIFIYDEVSKVGVIHDTRLLVTSSASITTHRWQWNTTDVSVDWEKRYINPLHYNNGWLKQAASTHDVTQDYDDNNHSRGIDAIDHVQGIVEYRAAFLIDHSGGSSILFPPPDADFQGQGLTQHQTVKPVLVDGDTVRFWVRAYDIRRELLEESVTVHVDTSPPVIENLWLTRGDRLNISVHRVEEFNEMTFEWLAFDDHSGLETVSWRLYDNITGSHIYHGEEHLSAQGDTQTMANCTARYGDYARGANCYCTPGTGCYHRHFQIKPRIISSNLSHGGVFHDMHKGVHDSDYFIEITVMNHAKLNTSLAIKVTVDASAPHPGVVHDGQPGHPEVDYQDSLQLHAHWDGFFDRESGVKFYQYQFSDKCLQKEHFGLDTSTLNVTETYSTHAAWSASSPGTYHVTVVAYNRALEESDPVCSDGVTLDDTPPAVGQIAVAASSIAPGLVTTSSGMVWFIDNHRRRSRVTEPNTQCRSKGTAIDAAELEKFPIHVMRNGTMLARNATFCIQSEALSSFHQIFISTQHHLFVNWTGTDAESGIYDYEVGLMSDPSGEAAPDILPYTSTHHHPQYQGYHPSLSEGQPFYIAIKAINKAGLTSIQVLGRLLVHTQKPVFNGGVTAALTPSLSHLLVTWNNSDVTDPDAAHLKYEAAVGTSPYGTEIRPFIALQSGAGCTVTSPPTCTAVALRDLHWDLHYSHAYYVSVRVTNTVGLSTVAVAEPYVHDVTLPSRGVVMDVCPESEEELFQISELRDSDYQLSTRRLKARWYGFDDDILNVTYRAGIGTRPGVVDVRGYEDTGHLLQHQFTNLLLNTSQKYYTTLVAKTGGGEVTQSSDGVYIIFNNADIVDMTIYDGRGCDSMQGTQDWNPTHHNMSAVYGCHEDQDYQLSTSMFAAHWNITQQYTHLYPDVKWKLERRFTLSDDLWHTERDYEYTGHRDHVLSTGLDLKSGYTFRAAVKLCAVNACTDAVYSNGVTVLHHQPASGNISVNYTNTDTGSKLEVAMARFADPGMPVKAEAFGVVDRYEWSLTDSDHDSRLLTTWQPVSDSTTSGDVMTFHVLLPQRLDFSKCRRLAVRGYNKVGLSTTVSADVRDCAADDPAVVVPAIVIDAVGARKVADVGYPITLEQNERWNIADADYTPHRNILSAVWPTLRHRNYTWAVVSGDQVDPSSHYKRESLMTFTKPCSIPDVIKCGHTDKEFINVAFVETERRLVHGRSYYVCVHADARTVENEKWTEDLPEVNSCSDGVTVDVTPPSGGRVFLGGLTSPTFQTSTSEMVVYWDGFTDVEEEGSSPHPSGIAYYEVALGSDPGGEDVAARRREGLVNHAILHGLRLHDGHTIYASVTATDFVNKSRTVISSGVLIDSTPPVTSGGSIHFSGQYITKSVIDVCWDRALSDPESGVVSYDVGVGSRPAYDDVVKYTSTTDQCMVIDGEAPLVDGHVYFVSVKGYNEVGLHSLITSRPVTADNTPPSRGHVYDGQRTNVRGQAKDADFVTLMSEMGSYWEGFSDPHSSISHYLLQVGTCRGCDDTLAQSHVGARTDVGFYDIAFKCGMTYYVTVTACNMASLCTMATSDGVILDVTAPRTGNIMDGTRDEDVQYQASRTFLGCKWRGFQDPESGLDHYEWRVGTTPEGDEILAATNAALEEAIFHTLSRDHQLPVGQTLYTTVRAYNKAGLYSEITSNGFLVDITPPEVVVTPGILDGYGSIVAGTSISRTTLRIGWKFKDEESYIERQYLSISSHQLGEFKSSLLKLPGLVEEYTLSQLDLHDGSSYTVKLVACNMAGLCHSSDTGAMLVDSSKPLTGALAVHTDHAAGLSRHQSGWMTWNRTRLNLAWLGFSDLHSGITHYIITAGSAEFGTDLTQGSTFVLVQHNVSGIEHDDEGRVQTGVVDTKDLSSTPSVFVAVWAVNGVGLQSDALHLELELGAGGKLELVRRCQSYNCGGHCVCAVQHRTCHPQRGCTQLLDGGLNNVQGVTDVTDLRFTTSGDIDHSPSDTFMAARWTVLKQQGLPFTQYEVSLGVSDSNYPTGVFDSHSHRVWFSVGRQTSAVISLTHGENLSSRHMYSFFVRGWYNATTYSIFKSDGVTVDTAPPKTTDKQALAVIELSDDDGVKDADFQKATDTVRISWTNKFLPGAAGILKYRVYVSTSPGGHSIHASDDLNTTKYTARGLSLQAATVYYSSVLAYNRAGLVSWAHSDGVRVDVLPPVAGRLDDGQEMHDTDYQSSPSEVSASWHGFSDTDSTIITYFWCVGKVNDTTDCSVLGWRETGLHTTFTAQLASPLPSGTRLWSKVYAVDAVGHASDVAVSDGVVIDTSPPEPKAVAYLGGNSVKNPSFETQTKPVNSSTCNEPLPEHWQTNNSTCIHIITSERPLARHGSSYVVISGSVLQRDIHLSVGQVYKVKIHVGYTENTDVHHSVIEGFVSVGIEVITFRLEPNLCRGVCDVGRHSVIMWNTHTFSFIAREESTQLTIGTTSRSMAMAVDHVTLQRVKYGGHDEAGDTEKHVEVNAVFLPHWSSVHVSWHFTDTESPITMYQWAVGLVEGGTQVQGFINVGRNPQGTISAQKLSHNSRLYVSVLATNAAGLTSMTRAGPVTVDMTPPTIQQVNDGSGVDADFLSPEDMAANWAVEDQESDSINCDIAIGHTPGDDDVSRFARTNPGVRLTRWNLTDIVTSSGVKVYTTVRCHNNAGQTSESSSDGVVIVSRGEVATVAGFKVLEESPSVFSDRGQCHVARDTVRLHWEGGETQTPYTTMVHIEGSSLIYEQIVPSIFTYTSAQLCGLKLSDLTTYNISAMLVLDKPRYPTEASITMHGPPPSLNKAAMISSSTSDRMTTLSWPGLFTSPWGQLVYEVMVGRVEGGADVVDGLLTRQEQMKLNLSSHPQTVTAVYVSITAIDACGYTAYYSQAVGVVP
ncbi:uncharacterized protein [Haliotis cracherodii]|uniref:uncharacterized protein n=1 Tax=Haliotis cracherodii TaxID=6455 RepID=UPI0039EB1867